MKQEMMGWQWHQLNHMQIIYTSLQQNQLTSWLLLQTTAAKHRIL